MINLGIFPHLMSVVKASWMQIIGRPGRQYGHKSGAEEEVVQYSSSSSPSPTAGPSAAKCFLLLFFFF